MNLFKLKKDGKAVGYELHAIATIRTGKEIVILHSKEYGNINDIDCYNIVVHPDKFIVHDEKCPYVCDDKNGDKVFARDKVKGSGGWGSTSGSTVFFDCCDGAQVEIGDHWINLSRFNVIELLKDKDND